MSVYDVNSLVLHAILFLSYRAAHCVTVQVQRKFLFASQQRVSNVHHLVLVRIVQIHVNRGGVAQAKKRLKRILYDIIS